MRRVLLFIKLIECALSMTCMGLHIKGFLNKNEPFPHEVFFCGTYFAYTLESLVGCYCILMRLAIPLVLDVVLMGFGAIAYLVTSILAMAHAENDHHLLYLTDREEWLHPYFAICRQESVVSLFTGLFYLMHFTLIVDMLVINKELPNEDNKACQPLQLNVFFEPFFNWLMSFKCCSKFQLIRKLSEIDIHPKRNIDRII